MSVQAMTEDCSYSAIYADSHICPVCDSYFTGGVKVGRRQLCDDCGGCGLDSLIEILIDNIEDLQLEIKKVKNELKSKQASRCR